MFEENNSYEFFPSILKSFLTILVSEIGDKSFFVCTALSMKLPKLAVILGNVTALSIMTIIAAIVGEVVL